MTGSQLRDSGRPCDSPRSWGPAPGGLELVGGGLRSSRGRTRTCDPLTPNGHDRVLGRRKIRDWRAGNPEETSETHPNRTRPTVPEPYRAKRSETSEQHRSPPDRVQFSLAAYRRFTPSRGGVGNTTLERRQGVGLLYIVCLMTPRTPQYPRRPMERYPLAQRGQTAYGAPDARETSVHWRGRACTISKYKCGRTTGRRFWSAANC